MLPARTLSLDLLRATQASYHAGAWEDVPTESDSIALLNIIPAVLQSVEIHSGRVAGRMR